MRSDELQKLEFIKNTTYYVSYSCGMHTRISNKHKWHQDLKFMHYCNISVLILRKDHMLMKYHFLHHMRFP